MSITAYGTRIASVQVEYTHLPHMYLITSRRFRWAQRMIIIIAPAAQLYRLDAASIAA